MTKKLLSLDENLTNLVAKLDPKGSEFVQIAEIVAQKMDALRKNKGLLPYNLFLVSTQAGGITPSIEIIIRDREGNLYLKRREGTENQSEVEDKSWGGKLHLPGSVVIPTKKLEMILYDLLDQEVVGGKEGSKRKQQLANLYRQARIKYIHCTPVPERRTKGFTVLVDVTVSDPSILREDYEQVDIAKLDHVIKQHRQLVKRILENQLPQIWDQS